MPQQGLLETVQVGPMGFMFSNRNRVMALKGHSHYAKLTLVWRTVLFKHEHPVGFPSFDVTVRELEAALGEKVQRPIVGTNEDVARMLWLTFDGWDTAACQSYGCRGARPDAVFADLEALDQPPNFMLWKMRMIVYGVRDEIGHAPGGTTYTIERTR